MLGEEKKDDRQTIFPYTTSRMSRLIFTTHLKERIAQRKLSAVQIEQTIYSPDKTGKGKEYGTTEYVKRFGSQTLTLIAKKSPEGEWIAISAWIDPPYPGTNDAWKKDLWRKSQKAGFWGKWWITFRRIIGI